jgi:hypothetical protein
MLSGVYWLGIRTGELVESNHLNTLHSKRISEDQSGVFWLIFREAHIYFGTCTLNVFF